MKKLFSKISNTWRWIILGFIAILIVARLILPYVVKSYVNDTLATMEGYHGHVDDITISLWRGAYGIVSLNIEKTDAKIPVPFISVAMIDLSIEWPAIFHGSLVGAVTFNDMKVNFVEGATKKESQNGADANFLVPLKKLFPFQFNKFDVNNGEIHFQNLNAKPPVDIHVDELQIHAVNLTNSEHLSKTLVATIDATGKAMHVGALQGHLEIDPYAEKPLFKLAFQLTGMQLKLLNDFFHSYAYCDVDRGTFQFATELSASHGKFDGYVKPLFHDMHVLPIVKGNSNPLKVVWEVVIEGVAWLFTNKATDELGAKIPISGTFEKPSYNIFSILGGVFVNAFITALHPGIDGALKMMNPPAK